MRKERGVTLLEAIFSIAIFTILLQILLQFFMTIYVDTKVFERKAYLEDNARAVKTFICEQVAESKAVQIECKGGGQITPILEAGDNSDIADQELKQILLDGEKKIVMTKSNSKDQNAGHYLLNYLGNGWTTNLISDQIDSLKVTRHKDSDYVEWTCVLAKKGESNPDLKETMTFTTPLGHKEKKEG